jgi:hypothetical protein
MIRHQYQGCVPCHTDPSGAGLITEYGRAMGENVMRTRYGSPPPDEPPPYARFAFGVPLPEWLLLGGSFRNGVQLTAALPGTSTSTTNGVTTSTSVKGTPFSAHFLEMEADLKAAITVSRFRAYGSMGYMYEAAQLTQLTHFDNNNLVSREHWIGVDLGDDKQFLLRAGRIDIPFGIRFDEHDLLVRSTQTTRTNINESQQHGVAFSYNGEKLRGELMAILGNYQLNPDAFRERGYAGFLEYNVAESKSIGVSSMVTYAKQDYQTLAPGSIRQLHGVFARLTVAEPLVLLIEADAQVLTYGKNMVSTAGTSPGFVGVVQADIEPTQGLHLVVSGETYLLGNYVASPTSEPGLMEMFGVWGGLLWFFAPHADLRIDAVTEVSPSNVTSVMGGVTTKTQSTSVNLYILPQFHVYL